MADSKSRMAGVIIIVDGFPGVGKLTIAKELV
jgi:tRNA uridine 5-carbamoylmethylation protein Kti12